ncbi:hypothetical protein PV797_03575 [Clostridiaceae bacterium M8S5]|nr:hypothetical protein PV797_03575 [Clostridiaceae bacterium M8S5]
MSKQSFFNYKADSAILDYCGPNTGLTWCDKGWPQPRFNAV